MSEFVARNDIALQSDVGFYRPKEPPKLVHLDSPAGSVMTDFKLVRPITTKAEVAIDRALEGMKKAGVRLLLVTNNDEHLIGMVTANDIQGEKPIQLSRASGVQRNDIKVGMIMTSYEQLTALNMMSVRDSQVGHIVETLHKLERQHILVVEVDRNSGRQCIRGLFSISQINRQLGRDMVADEHAAHSLAEILHVVT